MSGVYHYFGTFSYKTPDIFSHFFSLIKFQLTYKFTFMLSEVFIAMIGGPHVQ